MRDYEYSVINIDDLYVNPENFRYVDEVENEVDAIIAMFNVKAGEPRKEMINLARDIIEDGLNPFEMPIVCFDETIGKYIVYDGNRRVTTIKLMTQYKDNKDILEAVPTVAEIYKLHYPYDNQIQCVVYYEEDDAIHFLNKIHNDINNGIGRKQWNSEAKMKANAAYGNKTKSYAIVEFLRSNPNTDTELLKMMSSNRWISKLERVVGFAKFKEVYNIQFDNNSNMSYLDTEEHVLKMLSKLVYDIITNSATGKFRFKDDFDKYTEEIGAEYKSLIINEAKSHEEEEKTKVEATSEKTPISMSTMESGGSPKHSALNKTMQSSVGMSKATLSKHLKTKEALHLSKSYTYDDYACLNEKGREVLVELENLNIKQYPVAAVALCRSLLEYTVKLWMEEQGGTFNSSKLPSSYNGCVNLLRSKNIIDSKEHTILTTSVNKEEFITLLNTWLHADTDACVSETPLVSGWNNVRLLVEKYIDLHC